MNQFAKAQAYSIRQINRITTKQISLGIVLLKLILVGIVVVRYLPYASTSDLVFDETFFWFILAGFLAQLVDGALGMAYGATSSTLLLSYGLPPKLASAAVHTAEVFTTGVSGLSHIRFGNFDKRLFFKLIIPGVIFASLGAFLLGSVIDGDLIRPYVSAYLLILGVLILLKAFKKQQETKENTKGAPALAAFGAFLDAIGGGGWGPIVTSNLIRKGNSPSTIIGTVNTAEFFVTYVTAGVLIYFTGINSWQIILGLILGGVLAAPLGALIVKKVSKKTLFIAVGSLIIITSLFSIYTALY
ncbi:sulfite exporter TauE/SafE family protein [Parapedobacter lycopersici]|uniref:sulfite exporter TauE/SafE family protein n=1 Tax=Parapedobacter lycopersici TaxID=1864939 RepID=UPI00214D82A5|nr:sulfite exporter TauE/SafE family protein [Parapedobacter lycopersici]